MMGKEFQASIESNFTNPNSYVSSAKAYMFDEDNIHSCVLSNQVISKKSSFRVGELIITIYKDFEFGNQNDIIEVPLLEMEGEGAFGGGDCVELESSSKSISNAKNSTDKQTKARSGSETEEAILNSMEGQECVQISLKNFLTNLTIFKENPTLPVNAQWRVSSVVGNLEVTYSKQSKRGNTVISKILSKLEKDNKQSLEQLKKQQQQQQGNSN
jgi:hypothetical protein